MRDNTIYKEIIRGQIIDSCETTLSGILTLDGIRYEDLAVDRRRVIVCQNANDVEFLASGYMSKRMARAFLTVLAGISIRAFLPKKFLRVAEMYIFTFSSVQKKVEFWTK